MLFLINIGFMISYPGCYTGLIQNTARKTNKPAYLTLLIDDDI
jgi:hypothetical protein